MDRSAELAAQGQSDHKLLGRLIRPTARVIRIWRWTAAAPAAIHLRWGRRTHRLRLDLLFDFLFAPTTFLVHMRFLTPGPHGSLRWWCGRCSLRWSKDRRCFDHFFHGFGVTSGFTFGRWSLGTFPRNPTAVETLPRQTQQIPPAVLVDGRLMRRRLLPANVTNDPLLSFPLGTPHRLCLARRRCHTPAVAVPRTCPATVRRFRHRRWGCSRWPLLTSRAWWRRPAWLRHTSWPLPSTRRLHCHCRSICTWSSCHRWPIWGRIHVPRRDIQTFNRIPRRDSSHLGGRLWGRLWNSWPSFFFFFSHGLVAGTLPIFFFRWIALFGRHAYPRPDDQNIMEWKCLKNNNPHLNHSGARPQTRAHIYPWTKTTLKQVVDRTPASTRETNMFFIITPYTVSQNIRTPRHFFQPDMFIR